LLSAKHDEPSEEKGDHQSFSKDEAVVMPAVGLGQTEEQEKQSHECLGIVVCEHHAGEDRQIYDHECRGYALPGSLRGRRCALRELAPEQVGKNERIDDDGEGGLCAEGGKHEPGGPAPLRRNHENRRSSKVSQCAADGDVDE
jgi:hypothetical protein